MAAMAVGQPCVATMAYTFNRWNTLVRSSTSMFSQSEIMSSANLASCWSRPVIRPACSLANSPAAIRWTTPVLGRGNVASSGDLRANQLKSGSSAMSAAGGLCWMAAIRSTVWVSRVRASSKSGACGRRGRRGEVSTCSPSSSCCCTVSSSEVGVR